MSLIFVKFKLPFGAFFARILINPIAASKDGAVRLNVTSYTVFIKLKCG